MFDDVQGDAEGVTSQRFAGNSPSITTAPYPSMEKGMGWRPAAGTNGSAGYVLIRGGCWGSGRHTGVFSLNFGLPGSAWDVVGFRCTK